MIPNGGVAPPQAPMTRGSRWQVTVIQNPFGMIGLGL
jgi:hypothetical protein